MYTGYKMSKIVNTQLELRGLKKIPPQMIYQYISKGYIKSSEVNGQSLVHPITCEHWTRRYITKRVVKG
jgi:hypothetical protein